MNPLPLRHKMRPVAQDLDHKRPHIGPLDAHIISDFRGIARSEKVDLRLPRASNMNVRRFVIERLDHKPEAMRAVDDNHRRL